MRNNDIFIGQCKESMRQFCLREPRSKDKTMSNYITPGNLSPAPVPAGVTAVQSSRATEAAKPELVEAPKPVLVTKVDPREIRLAVEETWDMFSRQMQRNCYYLSCSLADMAEKILLKVKNKQWNVIRMTRLKHCLKVSLNLRQ